MQLNEMETLLIEADQRTKDIDVRVTNIDTRTSRIEQILPTVATKEDLERFATKEDLERFATKEDLERFATKEDLERFATKEDIELYWQRTKVLFEDVRDDVRMVAESVLHIHDRLDQRRS